MDFDAQELEANLTAENYKDMVINWGQVSVAKDLTTDYKGFTQYSKMYAKIYYPNYVARQLG